MILEGDHSVIDAIKEKKRLMDVGEAHEHIKPLLVIGGGFMKVAYSWGACIALSKFGYAKCFETIVGVSSGALAAAYLLSGNIESNRSLVFKEAYSQDFFSFWRPFNILQTKYLRTFLSNNSHQGLAADKILDHQPTFLIGLSEFETARPKLLRPSNDDELFEGLRATISLAGAVSDPVIINGQRYLDGETTYPYIRESIYDLEHVTHILDFTNQDKNDMAEYSYGEAFLLGTLYRGATNAVVRYAANSRRALRKKFLEQAVRAQKIPTCLLWGDETIGSLNAHSKKIETAVARAELYWTKLLA